MKRRIVETLLALAVLPSMLTGALVRKIKSRRGEQASEAPVPRRRSRVREDGHAPQKESPPLQAESAPPGERRRRRQAVCPPAQEAPQASAQESDAQPVAEQPAQEGYSLEVIRPQDYHGAAHRHAQQAKKPEGRVLSAPKNSGTIRLRARRKRRPAIKVDARRLLSLALACVALVSAFMVVSILWRTVRTTATNRKLSKLYEQASEATAEPTKTPAPELTPQPTLAVFAPEETPVKGRAVAAKTEATDTPPPKETPLPMGKRAYHVVGGDALPEMAALHKENRDLVGWLKIENVLDLPVVYRDNEYYLKRDFYKQKNTAGTLFLDENHPFKEKTQNLLLHGHNMKDGTMFGRLIQYEADINYVRWHPFVRFDTLWRREEYVIFAVLRVSLDTGSEDFFNYFTHPTFSSDAAFESYVRQLQLRSLYAIPIDVKPTDALLTLSTCLEEDRLVIVARRVREGETHTQIRAITNTAKRQ